MTFLPIVARELRAAARRRSTFAGRMLAAAVPAFVLGWLLLTTGPMMITRGQLGPVLFQALAGLAFAYCLFAGIVATADSISEEKREGTLGLLFLTDLRGYDVVFGKLAASSLNTFYNLLALFPIMAVPFLLGGVSDTTYARVAVLLVNTLLLSLAAGLFVSSLARSGWAASGGATLLMAGIVGGFPLLSFWVHESFRARELAQWLLIPSPAWAFGVAQRPGGDFWLSVAVNHAFAWGLLGAASWLLPRRWQDKAPGAFRERVGAKAASLVFGRGPSGEPLRARLLDINPILWLNSRNRMDSVLIWVLLAAGATIWCWCAWRWPNEWFDEGVYITTAIAAHVTIKGILAGQACRQFADDRRTGALELLLATPLSVTEMAHGHLLALRRIFGGPIAVVVAVDLIFAFACLWKGMEGPEFWRHDNAWNMFWVIIGGIATLLADAWAIAWLGIWYGVTAPKASRASGAVLARVIFLPCVVMWFLVTGIGTMAMFGRSWFDVETVVAVWFGLGLVNAAFWISFARKRIHSRLRLVAVQRFDGPKPGLWARLLFSSPAGRASATPSQTPPRSPANHPAARE